MGSRIKSGCILWRALIVLIAGFVSILASTSEVKAQQTQAAFTGTGRALCGAMDLRTNTLLGACGFASATKTGKAVGECPRGSFFDIGTWSCFSCPSGYNRTGFAVDTPKACSKQVSAEYKRATRVGAHKSCPRGSFKDLRNGGECWSCPAGFGRTLSAVNEWDACGKIFESARRAEFIDRVCPEGSFPDLNGSCYTCPDGYRRTAAAVSAHNACFRNESLVAAEKITALTCKAGEHFDFVDGGTCWSCPDGSVRSVHSVKTNKACEYTNMRWESAKRTPNGLFGLPGAHEIVAQVITERTRIEATIEKFITDSKMNNNDAEEYRVGVWKQIKNEPEASLELKGAVYNYLYDVIKRGAKTKPEQDMVNYLATYVQDSRKLTASEMSNVWESWQRGREAWRKSRGTNLASAYDTGVKPPDTTLAAKEVMHLGPAAGIGLIYLAGFTAEAVSPAFAQAASRIALQILPYRFKEISQGVVVSSAGFAGAAVAPLVVLTAASVIASFATEIALEQNKQEAIVKDAVAVAQRPVNLARLLKTDDGRNEVAGNWALMTQEPVKPNTRIWAQLMPAEKATGTDDYSVTLDNGNVVVGNFETDSVVDGGQNNTNNDTITLSQIESTGTAGAAGRATNWDLIPGDATDVAIGTDGTTYVIGVSKAGGGYEIFKRAKTAKRWIKMAGAAVRIAVSDKDAWVVNDAGLIFAQSGTKWRQIPGPAAQDIGASANGVWITAVDNTIHVRNGNRWQKLPGTATRIDIDQNGRPWVVNKNGDIFVHDNNKKWQKLPGAAVDIAVDIPGAALIIGTDGKTYLFNAAKQDWDPIVDETDSRAIGAGDGQVWRLTKNNKIYQMQ
ncbi:tectonin domain-containing protein [Thalassospira profundimaris]